MELWILSVAALALFLWYDVWTVRGSARRWMRWTFALGFACMAAATIRILVLAWSAARAHPLRAACLWAAALVCLALLVYTLFFALSFDGTYRAPDRGRKVCRSGMYALCRHPGVLWFFLFYLLIWLGAPCSASLLGGSALCAANFLYILVQDLWTFPRTFTDYDDYRLSVPFLIPTPASVRAAARSFWSREEPRA